MATFTTITDVIEQIVLPSLGEYAADYDVEAIARDIYEWQDGQIVITAEGDDFWEIAERHAK